MSELRRELEVMPYDKTFEIDDEGRREGCHATGYEICFDGDDPEAPGNWWNEYVDREGNLHYGR